MGISLLVVVLLSVDRLWRKLSISSSVKEKSDNRGRTVEVVMDVTVDESRRRRMLMEEEVAVTCWAKKERRRDDIS